MLILFISWYKTNVFACKDTTFSSNLLTQVLATNLVAFFVSRLLTNCSIDLLWRKKTLLGTLDQVADKPVCIKHLAVEEDALGGCNMTIVQTTKNFLTAWFSTLVVTP